MPQEVLCVLVLGARKGPLDQQVHNLSNTSQSQFALSFVEVSFEDLIQFPWFGISSTLDYSIYFKMTGGTSKDEAVCWPCEAGYVSSSEGEIMSY